MFENSMWLFVVVGGPLILLIIFAYVIVTRRRKGPAEQRERDRATDRLYREGGD